MHRRELESRDINTLTKLASRAIPVPFKPTRGSRESYERAHHQALVQLQSRTQPTPAFEFRPPEPVKDDDKGKDKDKKAEPKEMRAFVIADVDAVSDLLISNVPGNQALFADAMRWLVGEESFMGQINTEEDIRIEHTKQQDLAWFYSTIFGVPAVVLGLGLFARRRMLKAGGRQ